MNLRKGLVLLVIGLLAFSNLAMPNTSLNVIEPGKILGTVIDARTEAPLAGANVFVNHGFIGTSTDNNGSFVIHKAPLGKVELIASMIGYKPVYKEIVINQGETISVDFTLKEGFLEMGAVVVTGTSIPHIFEDVPVKTEVVSRATIAKVKATDMAEALALQSGVRVENNCQNCNFTQVRLLGMEGPYTQILVDSDPVISSLAGVYGLEQFPAEMIEQIEVVKGGGSALYGGGAIAGTVNLMTRTPLTNRTHIKYQGQSIGQAGDNGISVVSERVNESRTSGAYLYGTVRQRNQYDHNDDGYSELGELSNQTIGVNWYSKPLENGKINLNAHHIHEKRRGGDHFDVPMHEANVAEGVEHLRWGGTVRWEHRPLANLDYRFYYSLALTDRDSYYGGLGDPADYDANNDGIPDDQARLDALAAYGTSSNQVHVGGFRTNFSFGNQIFTTGLDYSSDHLEDYSTRLAQYNIDETYTNFGFYLQDDVHFLSNEALEVLAGIRMDNHSELTDPVFSPRISAKYNLMEGLILRTGFSTGFKAPQVFDEDLHIESLGGDQRVIRNDPDLKEEKSYSFNIGFEYQNYVGEAPYSFAFSHFQTTLDNALSLDWDNATQLPDGTYSIMRVNNPGAKIQGFELNLGFKPFSTFEIQYGGTFKESKYEESEGGLTSFPRSPDIYWNILVTYSATQKLDLFSTINYTGESWVPHEEPADGSGPRLEKSDTYYKLDVGASYDLTLLKKTKSILSIGVKNALNAFQDNLDVGPNRDPAFVYGPSLPRTWYIGFEIEL